MALIASPTNMINDICFFIVLWGNCINYARVERSFQGVLTVAAEVGWLLAFSFQFFTCLAAVFVEEVGNFFYFSFGWRGFCFSPANYFRRFSIIAASTLVYRPNELDNDRIVVRDCLNFLR